MIAQLTGIVIEANFTSVILDVNGVGYDIAIPLSTFDKLPPQGQKATLKTVMAVRQDDVQLYGFFTDAEKALFKMLTAEVSGVGPKLALSVLSSMSVSDFATAILSADIKLLSKISGVGKRTAERMIVELKDKVTKITSVNAAAVATAASKDVPQEAQDAISALETLGFKKDAASKVVLKLVEEAAPSVPSAESLIRKALSALNS
ncbi:MAG: Holliday junction branch migration protein RuvA [Lentisphaeria bacterium]|nr:Holliday junction branch migration protein RuvA [Lentisphaeria bacterium]